MACQTRKKTHIPFLGQPARLPNYDLPTNSDVLRCLRFTKNRKYKPVAKIVSCSFTKRVTAECEVNMECCLLAMVKQKWVLAGLPIISDVNIKKKLENLYKTHSGIRENRPGPKVTAFMNEKDKLFDIGHVDLTKIVSTDINRSDQAKEEDLAFYAAKKEGRYGKLESREDIKFREKVERKLKRLQADDERKQKERERLEQDYVYDANKDILEEEENEYEDILVEETEQRLEHVHDGEQVSENEEIHPDSEKPKRKGKKPDFITLNFLETHCCNRQLHWLGGTGFLYGHRLLS